MWIVSGVRFPRQKRSCPSYSTGSRQNLRNVDFFLTFKMGFVLILTSNFKHSTCDHLDRFANPTTIPKHSEIYLTFRKVLSWSWLLAWVQVSLFFPNLLLGNSGLIVLFLFLSMIIIFEWISTSVPYFKNNYNYRFYCVAVMAFAFGCTGCDYSGGVANTQRYCGLFSNIKLYWRHFLILNEFTNPCIVQYCSKLLGHCLWLAQLCCPNYRCRGFCLLVLYFHFKSPLHKLQL